MAQELEDLPPKDAYCLAALPAIYQVPALWCSVRALAGPGLYSATGQLNVTWSDEA